MQVTTRRRMPGLRPTAGVVRSSVELEEAYSLQLSRMYTSRLPALDARLLNNGLEAGGLKQARCARLATYLVEHNMPIEEPAM